MSLMGLLGATAHGFNSANAESERLFKDAMAESDAALERARQRMADAGKRATFLQGAIDARTKSGDGRGAADLLPQFTESANTAFGINLKAPGIAGSPIMQEQLGPPMQGAMMPRVETGRDFNNPQTLGAIRGGAMLAPSKPEPLDLMAVSPYEDVINKATGKVLRAGGSRPATPRAPHYVKSTDAAGKPIWVEAAPGIPAYEAPDKPEKPVKDTSMKDYNRAYAEWQTRGASYVNDYVSLMARNSQRTRVQNGVTMTVPPTPEQMKAWREEGARAWRSQVNPPAPPGGSAGTYPFGNPNPPGGGKAAPARRGHLNIAPPAKYEDTALLPEWESHVQAALKVAPGVEISSRARSKARNAQAKPGGGAPDSWHMHRQAFDVIKYNDAQKAKLREWARSEGLHMIDEGNHLHFQPARVSDAGQAPALVAFYEKHGIKPGAANA